MRNFQDIFETCKRSFISDCTLNDSILPHFREDLFTFTTECLNENLYFSCCENVKYWKIIIQSQNKYDLTSMIFLMRLKVIHCSCGSSLYLFS